MRGPAEAVDALRSVFETVRQVRGALGPDKALIGFCGGPWTVATYMIGGHGGGEHIAARRLSLEEPQRLQTLIDRLVEVSAHYLIAQIDAGADVVKIFESWAGILDAEGFARWVMQPLRALVAKIHAARPGIPVIAFPRGAGAQLGEFSACVNADAIAVDWTCPIETARRLVPEPTVLQGNLDPLRLLVGGPALDAAVDHILAAMRGRPHVFNLGHGIMPETPIEHVTQLVSRIRRRND
jgi:uroporphyrinogen decarboxylase